MVYFEHNRHMRQHIKSACALLGLGFLIRKKYVQQVMKGKRKIITTNTAILTPWGSPLSHDSILGVKVGRGPAVTSALNCQFIFYCDLLGKGEASPVQGLRRCPGHCVFRTLRAK